MLRWLVTLALNAVFGAANGRAIASPLRARLTVSTTDESVVGTTLINFSGRVANFTAPLIAISSSLPPPTPSTGSGAGASGSVLHSCDIRLAPVTPSTPAWCTFVMTASRPPAVRVGTCDVLDDPHLPQRAAAIQRQRRDVAADLGQLLAATRRGKADAVQMAVDVEVVVVDPHRMVGVEPAVGELLAELRHRLDAQPQLIAHSVEGVAAGHGGRVQLQNRAHMQRLCCGFEVEEAGVESTEPLHVADRSVSKST